MVEKIELLERKPVELEINGKIYSVDLTEFKELVKYQRAVDKFLEYKRTVENYTGDDYEQLLEDGIKLLHNFINTVLNDENAVNDILGDNKENMSILFDLCQKLVEKTAPKKDAFVKDRLEKEYDPEE